MELPSVQRNHVSKFFRWLTGNNKPAVHELRLRQLNLRVVVIPPDGSPPHFIRLNTIDITSPENVDCCLGHMPDVRPYWGLNDGFHWRDVYRMTVDDQVLPELNGIYYGWKSFAMHETPISEHTGFCGEGFVAKTPPWEYDENGTVYEDVPASFIDSPLYDKMYERMHDRGE